MAFAVQQHELATGIHVPPDPEPSSPSFPNLSLWVVPEHWLWVPCFMHQTCTSHLFYIWYVQFQCCSLKSSHPRLLPLSPKVYSLLLCLLCCPACRILIQFTSMAQSCPTLCDPMDCSTSDFPLHHQLPEPTQTHVL